MIEFRKDFFVHLAVEQVGEDFVVYPCDELLLLFLAQPLFGEERIDVRFASGHILFAGFDTGFHVRETFGAFLGGLFVGFVVRLSLRHGQLRWIELPGDSDLYGDSVGHVLDDLCKFGIGLYDLHDRLVGRFVACDLFVALREIIVKCLFQLAVVAEFPVGEFGRHVFAHTRDARRLFLFLNGVFFLHFYRLILCVIYSVVKVCCLLVFKKL